MTRMILLAVLALSVMWQSKADVCPGAPYYSNLTMVTVSSAPVNYTSLDEWCSQYGLEFGSVSGTELGTINQLTQACLLLNGTVAVRAVNGMAWGGCLLVAPLVGFEFPSDPEVECARVSAVVCRSVPIVTETVATTVSVKTKLTTTVNTPTITSTASRTSSRLKTLPCGSTTTTSTLTTTTAALTSETDSVTTTVYTPTVYCPKKTMHICPTADHNLRLIAAGRPEAMAQQRQAGCACKQVRMRLAGGVDVSKAGLVLFGCMGGAARAWVDGACVAVDEDGDASLADCDPTERLPVLCTSDASSDHCDHHEYCDSAVKQASKQAGKQAGKQLGKHNLLQESPEQLATCGDSNVQLIFYQFATAISDVCAQATMIPMDYQPTLYSSAVASIAAACPFTERGWVRSLNGSVAQCQFLQFDAIASTIGNVLAVSSQYCQGSGGVWCVSSTSPTISTFTTGTVTPTSFQVQTETTTTTLTVTQPSFTTQPTTTTLTTTVTTVRSLVLTPLTTKTIIDATITDTDTVTVSSMVTSTVYIASTVTVFD